jgi:hypothetical protein
MTPVVCVFAAFPEVFTHNNELLKQTRLFFLRSCLRRESSVRIVTKAFDLVQQIITLVRWWNQLAHHLENRPSASQSTWISCMVNGMTIFSCP